MSWSPMSKPVTHSKGRGSQAAVSVGAAVKSLRVSPGLHIVLRPQLMQAAPAFLRAGALVSVSLGFAEHAGMLRLEPEGAFTLGRIPGRRPTREVLQLRVPLPPGVPEGRRTAHSVEFDYADDWLEITLPDWARAPAPAPAPSGTATPPARGAQLAAEAAEIARRKAGIGAR